MSGADLANLVNEAALFAVRAGDSMIRGSHFESARDRILMGQKRESTALSDVEKEAIAYHEAGHAVSPSCFLRPTRYTRSPSSPAVWPWV